ncbi:hypothetical protein Ddye_028471 [Dipteronia dyeriana]|uniref:AAA+ ATPase domain-containing protein n=1 Tax=Dipteronia dyeriana TaxID=168575 RepID=A0AAD9TR88_9ROSI|nr:hypothetical protein Ddye_028471 [Dipteronia dyeriana]
MDEIATSIAAKVSEYFVEPIIHPLSYIWNYKTNFQNLETELRKLNGRREAVEHSVEASRRNGEEIEQQVNSWIDSAKKINNEASQVIQENQQANTECLNGWCSNPVKRHKHSRKAAKKVKAVVEVFGEGDFERVSYRTIPEETWLPSLMKGYEAFESRMSTSKDILSELGNPDVNMVGVCGQSGIGKTMLVKEIARQAKVKKLFDEIVFAEVSKTPDIKKIQGEIADKLGLQFRKESESGRARALCARLKKENKILLILDDIWGRLDLDKVGIPSEEDHKGCKLLLTARDQDVLASKMDSQSNFPIGVLNEEEAWSLFKKTVGNCIEDPNLDSIAKDVAKACRGVPKVIVTKARELKHKGEYEWKNALVELRKPYSKSFNVAGSFRNLSMKLGLGS